MRISVSNLNFLATETYMLERLPIDIGLELFVEFGDDFFWEAWIQRLMKARKGSVSIHGPFQNVDFSNNAFSDETLHFIFERTFRLARDWNAEYVVVHPNAPYQRQDMQRSLSKQTVYRRLQSLITLAEDYCIPLAVENMGYEKKSELLLSENEYLSLFDFFPTLHSVIDVGKLHLAEWDFEKILRKLKSKVIAYHIHDNDGQRDQHLGMGLGSFSWDSFWRAFNLFTPSALIVLEYIQMPMKKILQDINMLQNK